MSFELINKYEAQLNTVIKSCSFGRKGKTNFIVLVSGKRIIIYDVKASRPIAITECEDDILQATLFEDLLLFSTPKDSQAINWETKQKVFESISGTLFPVSGTELLLLSSSTLYHNTLPSSIEEMKHFELGVLDFVCSPSFDQLAITSSITYLYDPRAKSLSEMQFVMSKLLFCNAEYLCGISIDRRNVVVRSVMANITVCQVPLVGKLSKVRIHGEDLYMIGEGKVRVWKLNEAQCLNVLDAQAEVQDLLLTEEALYAVTNKLELKGVKRDTIQGPVKMAKSVVLLTSVPENKENKPAEQSLVMEDLEKTQFVIESEEFECVGLISNFREQHSKFLATIAHRDNCLKGIHKWWSTGNYRACITAVEHHEDNAVINDSLSFMVFGLSNVPKEQFENIIRSCRKLIGSKYSSHVETGLTTINAVMNIANSWQFEPQTQRRLTEELKKVKEMPRLQKIMHSKIASQKKYIYEQACQLQQSISKYLRVRGLN